jgi:hypothetical protein
MNIREKFSQINNVVFRRKNGEQGSTLVVVLVMMVTMVTIAIGALKITQTNVAQSGAHKKGKQAFYAAEVGLDNAVNDIITQFEALNVYTTSAANGGTPRLTMDPFKNFDITYDITNPLDRFLYRTVVGNGTITHYAYSYEINSEAKSQEDNSSETLDETIRILETPLVQYFAFYAGSGDLADLELYPGADMNVWGRMHANGDMYIIGRNNDIVIRNYDASATPLYSPHFVSMGGEYKGMQKHVGSYWSDTDTFLRTNNDLSVIANPTSNAAFLEIPVSITEANQGTEEPPFNGFLHVKEKTYQAPTKDQFDRGGFYEQRSINPQDPMVDTMRIVGTGNGTQVFVSRPVPNTEVTGTILNDVMGANVVGAQWINGTAMGNNPITETAGTNLIYDGREQRYVNFTDLDLNLIGQWYEDYLTSLGLDWAGDGMLIYVSRSAAAANPNSGARLDAIRLRTQNGSQPTLLANTTVATDNPMYIHGNFNTINTKGVALVADAMNIMSSNLTAKGTSAVRNYPRAANTSVFAAFFSGIKPNALASGSRVGGGLHNYARLHEDWGNSRTLSITGSFISLWASTQATGNWCHSSYGRCYYRPSRNFGWDVRFEDPDFWPPFIPSIFSVERVGFLEG